MKKKDRRRCKELDRKYGLAKGSTEWLLNRMSNVAKKKGMKNGR